MLGVRYARAILAGCAIIEPSPLVGPPACSGARPIVTPRCPRPVRFVHSAHCSPCALFNVAQSLGGEALSAPPLAKSGSSRDRAVPIVPCLARFGHWPKWKPDAGWRFRQRLATKDEPPQWFAMVERYQAPAEAHPCCGGKVFDRPARAARQAGAFCRWRAAAQRSMANHSSRKRRTAAVMAASDSGSARR